MKKSKKKAIRQNRFLVFAVLVIASCGIFYELLISTVSSYFLGNSITHFSITIGLFMFFMGVGAYISKFIQKRLIKIFVITELVIGFLGGLSAFLLYLVFSLTEYYYLAVFLIIAIISSLIGLEIPIVTRIVKKSSNVKTALANILAFDYLGALIASILFPIVLLPYFGIMKTAFFIGFLNLIIALLSVLNFRKYLKKYKRYLFINTLLIAILIAGFIYSFQFVNFFEKYLYEDQIIYSGQTQYQRIVVTKFKEDVRLYLNGNLQFSTIDEYRYHEPLVHIPMAAAPEKRSILVLGGGDGLAARELLKYEEVEEIKIVDIDKSMTDLAKDNKIFSELNQDSLINDKVEVINEDAYSFVKEDSNFYDVVIIDLPDPNDLGLGKLYSREFYSLLSKRLSRSGVVATQSTSPYFAKEAFWCIHNTMDEVFNHTTPYNSYVPSFGLWGFNLAANIPIDRSKIKLDSDIETKYLKNNDIEKLFIFEKDIDELETDINTLDNQALTEYYNESWEYWN